MCPEGKAILFLFVFILFTVVQSKSHFGGVQKSK